MMKATTAQTVKRVRTCIACGAQEDKRALLRIVRASDGSVSLDPTGRAAGRGAYVCSPSCFAQAAKGKRLARALKVPVTQEDYTRIAGELERLGDSVNG